MELSISERPLEELPRDEVPYVGVDYSEYYSYNLKVKGVLKINDIKFKEAPYCSYKYDYRGLIKKVRDGVYDEIELFRFLLRNDLWFLVYFGMGVSVANHPFVVQKCREVEDGPETNTLDVWSRDHFKSTIITQGETLQYVLKYPEKTTLILSYTQKLAQSFFDVIRQNLETNEFFKLCFPDLLADNVKDLGKKQWTDKGINVRRKRVSKEFTVAASGLIDGMPTGYHYDRLIYDDISTLDLSKNPKSMEDVRRSFNMSVNLGTIGTVRRVIGTFYHYQDVLCYLRDLRDVRGNLAYKTRVVPATIDGTHSGAGVLLPESRLDDLRMDKTSFAMQNLCNPMPEEYRQMDFEMLRFIKREDLPKNLIKFMIVDQAKGARADGRDQDRWAILVVGVDPYLTDLGASRVYLLDGVIERMATMKEGLDQVCAIYMRNGWIHKLGVEQVALSSTEVFVANALKARGRIVSIENKMLHLLKPRGRKKEQRIQDNVCLPLSSGLIFACDSLPMNVRNQLKQEMELFPYFNDDGLDALSYVWDLLNEYHLPVMGRESEKVEEEPRRDAWTEIMDRHRRKQKRQLNWMSR